MAPKNRKAFLIILSVFFVLIMITLIIVLTQKGKIVNANAGGKDSSSKTTQQSESKENTSKEPETTMTTTQTTSQTSGTTTTRPKATKPKPTTTKPSTTAKPVYPPVIHNNIKGVWISYLDLSSFKNKNQSTFTSEMSSTLDNVKNKGLNTVILQVRSHSDAIYPSEYFPWSRFITSSISSGPGYDPLDIIISLAHSKGLSVHAWVNPYRVMTDTDFANVGNSFKTKQWYDSPTRTNYMIQYQSYWYLKPGNIEVRQLIIDGIAEIVSKYNVDAIHFDDYFYITNPSEYGDTPAQAKSNNTELVRGTYQRIKSIRPSVLFGISPFGAFNSGNTLPTTDTKYISTDLALWCNNPGYIDYVMPQIYWKRGHSSQDFSRVLKQWRDFVKCNSVALYTGLALYKQDPSEKSDPFPAGEIQGQVSEINTTGYSSGFCLFRYKFINNF